LYLGRSVAYALRKEPIGTVMAMFPPKAVVRHLLAVVSDVQFHLCNEKLCSMKLLGVPGLLELLRSLQLQSGYKMDGLAYCVVKEVRAPPLVTHAVVGERVLGSPLYGRSEDLGGFRPFTPRLQKRKHRNGVPLALA
jgi:hypothetical protein